MGENAKNFHIVSIKKISKEWNLYDFKKGGKEKLWLQMDGLDRWEAKRF